MPAADSATRIRELLAFFRATHYDVAMPNGCVATIRTGTRPPADVANWIGDALFAVYMTACNPYSRELSQDENERRFDEFRSELRALEVDFLEGTGHIPDDVWREPSLLVRGLDIERIDHLARTHEQNAVLIVPARAPSRMRIYRVDWRSAAEPAEDIEWANRDAGSKVG